MKTELSSKGAQVTLDDLQKVAAFDNGAPDTMESGDLYNSLTQQIILFEPETFELRVFFYPKDAKTSPTDPGFEDIDFPVKNFTKYQR